MRLRLLLKNLFSKLKIFIFFFFSYFVMNFLDLR